MSKLDLMRGIVELSHGSGGLAMFRLIEQLFVQEFRQVELAKHADAAVVEMAQGRMAVATDSHVIQPLFFPGGDIGSLAVYGSVNDVAMLGATPRYLTCGFILEEGLLLSDLQRIVRSMAQAARRSGVAIVAGDTKVVERGKGDGVFITTTCIGALVDGIDLSAQRVQPGDRIIVSGTMGDHGITILSQRENLHFHSELISDSAPLHDLVALMLERVPQVKFLRDPTRGGLAAVLNEVAHQAGVGMQVRQAAIPIHRQVNAVCELLGLDPLHVANEGKLVAICAAQYAEQLVTVMRQHPLGKDSAIIGEVIADAHGLVELETEYGTRRLIDWPSGDLLPRIC